MNASHFIVARDDLQQSKFIETALPESKDLPEEAVLVKVERFAFTANNITYALAGDQLKYWHLFPAPQGFGNIPVWGFGNVIASKPVASRRTRATSCRWRSKRARGDPRSGRHLEPGRQSSPPFP
jgi:hypothetical protein